MIHGVASSKIMYHCCLYRVERLANYTYKSNELYFVTVLVEEKSIRFELNHTESHHETNKTVTCSNSYQKL